MNKTNRREIRGRLPETPTARPDFRVTAIGGTDVGRRREVNEDSFLLLPKNSLFVVADGMGGHAGGQVASKLTVRTVGEALVRRLAAAEQEARERKTRVVIPQVLEDAVREACALVFDTARQHPELHGMGSTVTVFLAYGSIAYIAHVGDSRGYLVRDHQIHQLTEDHSLVQEQVAAGLITPEQARVSPVRNIITRSIGFEREVKVDVGAAPMQRGDQFILCSDGLTGHVDDDEILALALGTPPRTTPKQLIDLANSRGGEDNTTVVIATVQGGRGRQREKRRPQAA